VADQIEQRSADAALARGRSLRRRPEAAVRPPGTSLARLDAVCWEQSRQGPTGQRVFERFITKRPRSRLTIRQRTRVLIGVASLAIRPTGRLTLNPTPGLSPSRSIYNLIHGTEETYTK